MPGAPSSKRSREDAPTTSTPTNYRNDHHHNQDENEVPPPAMVIRSLPPLHAPHSPADDASLDPATLPIAQWTGPVSLTITPWVAPLPLPGQGPDNDAGTFVVANTRLYWWHASSGVGLALSYRAVMMHALQTDPNDGRRAVYLQVNANIARETGRALAMAMGNPAAAAAPLPDDNDEFSEVWVRPLDSSQADDLFATLSMCGSMHPDPMDEEDDAEDSMNEDAILSVLRGDGIPDGFITADNVDQMPELSEEGKANLARYEAMIAANFSWQHDATEDAEEEEE
ncbi:regulator of volume decrease after cellular swelling-domain-containing protein [Blastocladiella britannica]|nr:regulator of volume decrease after cellular swelling-domain-containing protein [Blastocladiella britannica]